MEFPEVSLRCAKQKVWTHFLGWMWCPGSMVSGCESTQIQNVFCNTCMCVHIENTCTNMCIKISLQCAHTHTYIYTILYPAQLCLAFVFFLLSHRCQPCKGRRLSKIIVVTKGESAWQQDILISEKQWNLWPWSILPHGWPHPFFAMFYNQLFLVRARTITGTSLDISPRGFGSFGDIDTVQNRLRSFSMGCSSLCSSFGNRFWSIGSCLGSSLCNSFPGRFLGQGLFWPFFWPCSWASPGIFQQIRFWEL